MSIILELQRAALDPSTPLTVLLRQCLAVASKLGLPGSLEWVQSELNGYKPETSETQLPTYRDVPTQIFVAFNPYHGWRPVQFENPDEADIFTTVRVYSPVSELEAMKGDGSGLVHLSLPPQITSALAKSTRARTEFRRQISKASVIGILDSVRNLVLEWALKLERDGIRGEGFTFTAAEQQKAGNIQVPGITISGSNNTIAIQHGTTTSSPQTVNSGTSAPDAKPKGGWLPEVRSKIVKAIPENWIVIALTSIAGIGGGVYAWIRGWIQSLYQ